MFEKIPTAIKVLIFAGVLLAGPVIVCSILFGGIQAAMFGVLGLLVYFMVIYIVGVRRYMGGK